MSNNTVIGAGAAVMFQPDGTPELLNVSTAAQQKTGLTAGAVYELRGLDGYVHIGPANSTADSNKVNLVRPGETVYKQLGPAETSFYYWGDAACDLEMVKVALSAITS